MLALDIETLGLMHETPLPTITCVCLYDGERETRLLFWPGVAAEEAEANGRSLLQALDAAPSLCGYNAVLFDLPYIQRHFGATEAQLQGWVAKCVDPFMCMKHILGRTCRLNALLELNGLGQKTGSGSNAILLAREGRTQELLDYCAMDAVLTHRLCMLPSVRMTEYRLARLAEDGYWRIEACSVLPERPAGDPLPAVALTFEGDWAVAAA